MHPGQFCACVGWLQSMFVCIPFNHGEIATVGNLPVKGGTEEEAIVIVWSGICRPKVRGFP